MKALVLLASLVILSACAFRGPDFDSTATAAVRVGMTPAQVVAIVGAEPTDMHGDLWIWNRVVVTPFSTSGKSFAVRFKDGRVDWIRR